jgi:hypothetical protein
MESSESTSAAFYSMSEENENPTLPFVGVENSELRYNTNPLEHFSACSPLRSRPLKSKERHSISPQTQASGDYDGFNATMIKGETSIPMSAQILSRVKSNIVPSPLTPAKIRQGRSIQRLELAEVHANSDRKEILVDSGKAKSPFIESRLCNDVEALLLFHEHKEEILIDPRGGEEALVLYHELKAETLPLAKPSLRGNSNSLDVVAHDFSEKCKHYRASSNEKCSEFEGIQQVSMMP